MGNKPTQHPAGSPEAEAEQATQDIREILGGRPAGTLTGEDAKALDEARGRFDTAKAKITGEDKPN